MNGEAAVKLPDCPQCRTPLDINGIDEKTRPTVIVYSCPRCRANYFQKVKTS